MQKSAFEKTDFVHKKFFVLLEIYNFKHIS